MPINEIGTIYTPSVYGRTSFPLKHNGVPLFYKKFDGSDENIVDVDNDIIEIEDHFLKTGEKLNYTLGVGSSSIQISSSSPPEIRKISLTVKPDLEKILGITVST